MSAWRAAVELIPQPLFMILLGSVIMGGILALLTGWLILVVVLPILALGLPYLAHSSQAT